MFSGIIQGMGKIIEKSYDIYKIKTDLDLRDIKVGSSISCNGVCLTASNIEKKENNYIFTVNISEETKNRSTFHSQKLRPILYL